MKEDTKMGGADSTSQLDCSVLIGDPKTETDRFIEEVVENFKIHEPMPFMDKNLFYKKQSEGRRFDGSLKRR
jgi:hypothetical protein